MFVATDAPAAENWLMGHKLANSNTTWAKIKISDAVEDKNAQTKQKFRKQWLVHIRNEPT